LINFNSNELNPVTVLSSEPYARPCREPRRRRRRHASAVDDPRSPRGRILSLLEATLPLSSPGSVSVFPTPSSSSLGSRRASRAELAAGAAPARPHCPASFPCAQCRASSPRTSSIHPRARPCRIPTESSPRPPATIDNPVELRPLSSSSTFRPPFAQIESPVSFSARPSPFPTLSPLDSAAAGAGPPPRHRGRHGAAAAPAAGCLRAGPSRAAVRPRSAGPYWPRRAPPLRRSAPPPARTPPPQQAAAAPRASRPASHAPLPPPPLSRPARPRAPRWLRARAAALPR
jgi:hypothetical protein